MELLVVGSVALDSVETPAERRDDLLGGSASYISVAASRFAPVSVVAVVGDDFPPTHQELLRSRSVDLSGLAVAPGRTFRWSGRYRENMNLRDTLSTELGVFEHFSPVLPARAATAEVLFLGNIHPALQQKVLDEVRGARFVGLDTMNLWIAQTRDALLAVLARVDLLLINEEEVRQLSGLHSLVAAAQCVRAMGPRYLVVTRGEYGALLFGPAGVFSVPALLLDQVKDPTGAGDSFAGGFMGYVAQQGSFEPAVLKKAMVVGTVMASFAVEDFSLDGLLRPDEAAISQRISELEQMIRLD
jgi:sugar/nucleoside kinase (ribokinase family)